MRAATTVALAFLLTTGARAERYNPWGPDDASYTDALRNYGKELLFATYVPKQCPERGWAMDKSFFNNAPPNLWTNQQYDAFMRSVMTETKNKADAQHARLGHEAYCRTVADFLQSNYPGRKPVISKH